jgi:hypothetical protein
MAFAQPAAPTPPETFGQARQLALSADRLFGFAITKDKETVTDPVSGQEQTTTTTYTGFSILGRGLGIDPLYNTPRLGVDYFVIDGLSLGGSITYMTTSTKDESPVRTRDGPTYSAFVFAPRVGYALMFNDFVGIWPRAGITYYNAKIETESTNTVNGVTTTSTTTNKLDGIALTAEVPLILSPAPHVALTLGPTLDFPLSGTTKHTNSAGVSESHDETLMEFGFQAGLLAWF